MGLGHLSLLQFLIDPFQYFSFQRIGIIPPVYLGRLFTIILVCAILIKSKKASAALFASFKVTLLSRPYYPFVWLTLLASFPSLFLYDSFENIIRYSFIEPFSTLVYISLFSILPSILSSPAERLRMSRFLLPIISIILLAGYLDYLASLFDLTLLGRSLFERISVGERFHSLLNEPRDYGVSAIYFLSLLFVARISNLTDIRFLDTNRNFYKLLVLLILLSVYLTKSISAAFGVALFFLCSILLMVFIIAKKIDRVPKFISLFILILLITICIPLDFWLPKRVLDALPLLESLLQYSHYTDVIETISSIPVLHSQASIILPLVIFFNKINFTFNSFYFSLFGYGHGHINYLLAASGLFEINNINNSFAGLPRLICETGFLGFFAFTYMYFTVIFRPLLEPLSPFAVNLTNRSKFLYIFSALLLFCLYLSHRRQELFLFMGFVNCYLPRPREIANLY